MNSLFSLAYFLGTSINFPIWCLIIVGGVLGYRKRDAVKLYLKSLLDYSLTTTELVFKRPLLSNVAGQEGFPVQLQIFEQELTSFVRTLLAKLRDSLKIAR